MAMLKIGDVAKRSGTSVATLRYYESIGVLPPALRSDSGQRLYGEPDLQRLAFVRRCRDFGFTIEEVRELVSLSQDDRRSCADARDFALRRLDRVRAQITELRRLAGDLTRLARECDAECAAGTGAECALLESLAPQASGCACG